MQIFLQIFSLILFIIFILSLIENKIIRIVIFSFLIIFLTLEIHSIFIGGTLIDYKFYQHFNFETIWAAKFVYPIQTLIVIVIGAFIGFIMFRILKLQFIINTHYIIKAVLILIFLLIMSTHESIFSNIYHIIKLKNTTVSTNFEDSVKSINGSKEVFSKLNNIQITQKTDSVKTKNIIVISMESLEKGYLSDNLAHLTPNLRKMSKEMTFFNMDMGIGSNWTAGSIYTELTGFPCIFKNQGNEIFQSTIGTKITGVGHILDKAGYDITYALANADFAGIKDMLTVNKFKIKTDQDFESKNNLSGWGTYDLDLFKEVKKIIKQKKKKEKPFALFMSTLGTHPPDGVYDKRFEGIIKPQKTKLEFMAASTDYLIGDLIKFLKNEKLLDNTIIYLFPDHLLMGTAPESNVIYRFPEYRSLFLLTNADKKNLSYSTKKTIYQIDIPKIILEGACIKHNVKFFTDLISGKDKLKYIEEHQSEILAINESSLIIRNNKKLNNIILKAGETLYSPNRKFRLDLQLDGFLVIYQTIDWKVIWSAPESTRNNHGVLILNEQCNLILSDKNKTIYWKSNTSKNNNCNIDLTDDGVLLIQNNKGKTIWSSSIAK